MSPGTAWWVPIIAVGTGILLNNSFGILYYNSARIIVEVVMPAAA
jgi:hypothetical protein